MSRIIRQMLIFHNFISLLNNLSRANWQYIRNSNRIITSYQVIEDLMDLDYPSEKRNELSRQLNQVDRRYGSIILSNPKIIMPSKPIPEKLKKKVLDLIYNCDNLKLVQMLQQNTISLSDQISKQGHAWTILHYACKNNSSACVQLCLRWLYQTDPSAYEHTLNQRNCDGDTALIVGCLHKANAAIKVMLQYGGVDIYIMNIKKLTAYQIALGSVNEEALQLLMKYELKIKRKNLINREALSAPLPELQPRTLQRIYDWFIECFYFGNSRSQIQPMKVTETDRRMVKKEELSESMSQIEIYWAEPEKKLPLFSAVSQPFMIRQSNIIVSNLLIVFQALAEHPQLLKRIISNAQQKFYVRLSSKSEERLVWVDKLFPYFNYSKDPLFLSLEDQIWPMVLHKALSQYYNGYFEPAKVPIADLISTISGNQSYSISLNNQMTPEQKQKIRATLLKIQSKNCILVLEASSTCIFKADQGRVETFSLIKILGDKFLINCPFTFTDEKRDLKSTRQMKLHQAHYNNPSCTTVWIDTPEFFQYFESATFCHTLNTQALRSYPLKMCTSGNRGYAVVKIKQRSDNDRLFLSFKTKEGETVTPTKCSGWSIFGNDRQRIEKINCQILGTTEVTGIVMPSEVLIMCEFEGPVGQQGQNVVIAQCRIEQLANMEALDCTIGDLEFIECCKKYYREHYGQYDTPIVQAVGDYILAMAASPQPCYIPLPISLSEDNVVEGMFVHSQMRLEMFEYGGIYFAVLSNVDEEVAKKLKIMSYETPKREKEEVTRPQLQSI